MLPKSNRSELASLDMSIPTLVMKRLTEFLIVRNFDLLIRGSVLELISFFPESIFILVTRRPWLENKGSANLPPCRIVLVSQGQVNGPLFE